MCLWRTPALWLLTMVLTVSVMPGIGGSHPHRRSIGHGRWASGMPRPSCKRPIKTVASWYGVAFEGHRMANGRVFHRHHLSAASLVLPLGSWVRVRVPSTARSVLLQIEDRGPYHRGRGLDVSEAAAERLGLHRSGVAPVVLEIVRSPVCFKPRH